MSGRSACISLGVGRLYVAYPYLEAMREPERRDRRRETLLPRLFFVPASRDKFHNPNVNESDDQQGSSWPKG